MCTMGFLPTMPLAWDPAAKLAVLSKTGLRGYKTFFVLNSTEYEISTAHKTKNAEK